MRLPHLAFAALLLAAVPVLADDDHHRERPPAEAAEHEHQAPPEAGTFESPPPGASKEDQALWKAARDANIEVPVERGISTRLQAQVNGSGWSERLDEAVRRETLDRKRAEKLSRELLEEWNALALVLSSRWPVDPTRVCSYPFLDFDNALTVRETGSRLSDARGRLRDCVHAATRIVIELRNRNAEYREAFDAIDRATPSLAEARAARAPAAASTPAPSR